MAAGPAAHGPAVNQRAVLNVTRRLARLLQRWLYLSHRWLGIGACLLFAMWFASGLVMMYVQFPALADDERRSLLAPIETTTIAVTPETALQAAGLTAFPRSLRLEMQDEEPVYRIIDWDDRRLAVSARDGRQIMHVDADQAVAFCRWHSPSAALLGLVERDQWTVTARYDPLRPFHLVALNDEAGTELYISARTGEIALDTTRRERFWNWLGAIPHWIYFAPLRADASLWRNVVMWIAVPGIVVAVSGLWLGIQRLRPRRRYPNGSPSPYRGWAKWHHISGLIGGLFLLTWIFSGWLSMNPNLWFTNRPVSQTGLIAYAGHQAPTFPASLLPTQSGGAVEWRLHWIDGAAFVVIRDARGAVSGPAAPQAERLIQAASGLVPGSRPVFSLMLMEEDAYWYSHHGQRPLPVLRIGFDDPQSTWLHIDPESGEILQTSNVNRRLYRWLFNALHSLDLPPLLAWRPAWDMLLWLLSLAGLAISVSGIVISLHHLGRVRRRLYGKNHR